MKRLLLHIGYPKTGTTALQTVVFPRAAGPDLGYLGVATAGAIRTDNRYLRWRREMTGLQVFRSRSGTDLDALAASRHLVGSARRALVISEEVLLTEPIHAALVGRRTRGRGLSRTLERLREMIPVDVELDVLITLRRQEELVPALVAQEAHRVSSRRFRRLDHALEVLQRDGSPLRWLFSFDEVVRHVDEVLRPASVTLLPIELLAADAEAYRGRLRALLGDSSEFRELPRIHSRRVGEDEWVTSYGPLSSLVHRAYASLPLPLPPEWLKRRSTFSATPRPRRPPPVVRRSEEDRALLCGLFADSNRRLEADTGLPLTLLGYATAPLR